jgi:succinoglycan biosynthesis protein ExoL
MKSAWRPSGYGMKIAYFVHDLADAAVHRRIRMLSAGGATVTPIGFRRTTKPISVVENVGAIDLGRTSDGRLGGRIWSVITALTRLSRLAQDVRGANAVLARNLEMLVLAVRARERYAPGAMLVYECLDIHRLLLSKALGGRVLRHIESRLWCEVDLLLTSSPAFVRDYFIPRGFSSPIRIVENKVLLVGEPECQAPTVRRPVGPPWRIGWFGMIRCRKSLQILTSLGRAGRGAVEIVIRGRPSGATFPDFDAAIANLPYVRFAGPYRNPTDLPSIYGDVHFSWAIDYYESGQNSTWLLPNRIYEGSLYGTVPLGLAQRGAGVVLDEPVERQLIDFFRRLDQDGYLQLASKVQALPRTDLVSNRADCRELVEALCAA